MVNYGITEDGRNVIEDICEDGVIVLDPVLVENGHTLLFSVNVKDSSVGLSISNAITKNSSIGLSVLSERSHVTSLGLRIVARKTKQSSIGVSVAGAVLKSSSIGLSISEETTKASSAGLSIVDVETKTSSIGLTAVDRVTKESTASLTVKASYTKESSASLTVVILQTKVSSVGLSIHGANTFVSSVGLTIYETVLKKGLFYGKLGSTILETVEPESFRISEEINKIPSFEFEVANSEANRTAIAANATALFKIYWQHHGLDTHIFTGIINADGIEYVSLTNIRITGFASYAKLGWPIYKHLNAEDAEPVNKVFSFDGAFTDYTSEANGGTDTTLDSMDSVTGWQAQDAMEYITLNSGIKKEGTGALNLIKDDTGSSAYIIKNIASTNLSNSNVKVWLYIKDLTTKNKISNAAIELGQVGAWSKWYFPGSSLSIGWNLLCVDTTTTPDATYGTLDLTSITKIYLFVNTTIETDTYAEGDVISDYYHYSSLLQVLVSFGGVDHGLYIGEANPFWGLQIKYSTPGVPAGAVVVVEFSKGSGMWATLDVLDETNAFTEGAGTYDIIISHPPSDWARNTVDGVLKFWLRWRVVSGAYTTSPKLDRIYTVNVDVYRVFYLATSARAILLDVLDGTEYSMDTTDACPEDEINLLAEYESQLRVIAAIPAALTWTDTDGSKKSYQWWIDDAKKVHIKQRRGTTHSDDITGDLTIFNNLIDYFNVSNRLFGFSKRDGLSQIRAIIENKASQTTHALREIAVPKNEIGKYLTLKASLEKDIAYSKDPMQRLKGAVSTEFWGLRSYEVGDTVTLHQGEWVVDEGQFQIVKVDMGPILTQLNLGISREHLEGLKSNLKRAFDISNVQMHGSTTIFAAGPETMNYERKSDGSVFSAKLKIDIPSEVTKTHKMLLSWTIGKYRASVNDETGTGSGHDHGGWGGAGGAIGSSNVGAGGAFTPDVLDGGDFTPEMLSEAHIHHLDDTLYIQHASGTFYEVVNDWVHGMNHRHSGGGTGYPDDTADAVTDLNEGTTCTNGWCIASVNKDTFALDTHYHQNSDTGYSSPNAWVETIPCSIVKAINPTVLSTDSNAESPAHLHDGVYEGVHPHPGVYEGPHSNHLVAAEPAHSDHLIIVDPGAPMEIDYGIHEEAAGTVLELLVNSEKVNEYSGDQTEIRIDGYLTTGANTVEIQPIASELGKKGGATIWGSGILFYEPKKF